MLTPTQVFLLHNMEASLKNETQRAAISAIIDEIDQTQREISISATQPTDQEARQIVERIERRLLSIDLKRPLPDEGDKWVNLGDAATAALEKMSQQKGR
jgi:hypothetical protein